jgi:mannitol/fructose-specific phosphotransferase system IIA component (Ntr-type)
MGNFNEVISKSVVCLNMSEDEGHAVLSALVKKAVEQSALERCTWTTQSGLSSNAEQSASTAMPDGIALPHGRIDGIGDLVCMIGIHPRGVDFGSPDGQPTHIFVELLVSATAGCNHIHFLANLSRRLLEQSVRTELLAAASREHVVQAILSHTDEGLFNEAADAARLFRLFSVPSRGIVRENPLCVREGAGEVCVEANFVYLLETSEEALAKRFSRGRARCWALPMVRGGLEASM